MNTLVLMVMLSSSASDLVGSLLRDADRIEAAKRGGKVAPMGRMFKALGPEALQPMLEALARPEAHPLSATIGMIEAVGVLRDERAAPVLLELLVSGPLSVTRSSAEAYGFLQTDAAAARLVELSRGTDARARAVREGMGSCRRVVIAAARAEAVGAVSEVREQVALARALGDAGNAWAWKTPGVVARAEESEVRLIAARALVTAFTRWSGDARQAASNALMVVDARETPALIAAAGASTELRMLAERFEKNPTR